MTYRERRLAKAERLRGWAEKRVDSANAVLAADSEVRHDWAFITQPGHIPQRARMIARDDRALASLSKAGAMASRADGIEAAAANAIYSDDPDAIEALEAKVAGLEAERTAIVAFNKAVRKMGGVADEALLSTLSPDARKDYERGMRFSPYAMKGGAFPAYHLSNLSGNIKRARDRIAGLTRSAAPEPIAPDGYEADPAEWPCPDGPYCKEAHS